MAKQLTKRETAAQLKKFRDKLLSDSNANRVFGKMMEIANNDEHPHQFLALKFLGERILPLAGFSAEQRANTAVQINITGVTEVKDVTPVNELDDGEAEY